MKDGFTDNVVCDGGWYSASSPEITVANDQGVTVEEVAAVEAGVTAEEDITAEECRQTLREAVELFLRDRRDCADGHDRVNLSARSKKILGEMADEALEDLYAGQTEKLDPDRL